jgi:septal ring factor EnvC (AmiA/AmiB activator)
MTERPGGPAIPNSHSDKTRPDRARPDRSKPDKSRSDGSDLERLERVVSELAAAYRHQRAENAGLRRELELRGQRIRALDGKILEANQKRQDVVKRIDELIAQIDQLDASFDSMDV